MSDNQSQPLWHGRFSSGPAEELLAFTESLSFDKRLWKDDIVGSLAHVKGLGHAGILPLSEVAQIESALHQVASEFVNGTFQFVAGEEDIHTSIERRVTQIAGPVGGKVHTGRSRNDQCVTALRLWTKRELAALAERLIALCDVLTQRADLAGWGSDGVYLPGYTHVQRAQPVLLAHHLMAHAWAFTRDIDRLISTIKRADVSPLGAGALAGSSLPLDPNFTAREMGFADRFSNSLDAVSDRDFVAEALFDLALIGTHLSRIGEEWVLWTSEEFGFATLDDRYATGSSMLPQKKNADIAELARGKAGRLIGNLTGLLTTLKGLPLAYNRDLQEDKEPLFDSYDQVSLAVGALTGMIQTATFNSDRMREAADVQSLSATDLAEYLVRKGTPFRQAHAIVGELVQKAISGSQSLQQLVADSPEFDADALQLIGTGVGVQLRSSPGAAGPHAAEDQRARFASLIASLRTSLAI
uniref:Argininosuccinate lyase n=1 Tax=uncultured Actinomycetes bacterium TaxID=152507 RepID=D0U617_9ACTN|nr:argininosuccinate lyase [uncultured Actinomycetes bacterium]